MASNPIIKNPNMPTPEQFMNATTVQMGAKIGAAKFGPKLSRDRLLHIDQVLAAWWKVPITDDERKMNATLAVMWSVSQWMKAHQSGKGVSRTGAARMQAMNNLMEQSKLWLGLLNQRTGKLKALDDHYRVERLHYKDIKGTGQRNPIGGSGFTVLKGETTQKDREATPYSKKYVNPYSKAVQDIANKDPSLWTAADVAVLEREFPIERTTYLSRDDRQQKILTIRGGKFADADGNPLTAGVIYAMDKYGTVYAHDQNDAEDWAMDQGDRPTRFFNHSSFLSGKDVVCAGTIEPYTGTDKNFTGKWKVTTASGHYKPSGDQLKNALKALEASGLDLRKHVANVMFPNDDHIDAHRFVHG